MRFMVLLKADKNTEAGVLPSTELIAAMMKYNEELTKAGVLLAGEGLQPSSKGTRVKFSAGKRTVIDRSAPLAGEIGSQRTRRWRKPDSNPRFLSRHEPGKG